jgi:hypothetical protein
MFPNKFNNSGIKRRAPYISNVGPPNGNNNNKYKPASILYCKLCGFKMVYVESFHAYYCNECGASEDPNPEELSQVLEQDKKQSREATFSTADGSPIYNSSSSNSSFDNYGRRRRRHSTLGGRTINMKSAMEDKLGRPKSYTEKIFEQETNMLERSGNTITAQHTEIRKSPDIISSSDLIANKGNVGIRRRSSSNEKRRRQSHDIS